MSERYSSLRPSAVRPSPASAAAFVSISNSANIVCLKSVPLKPSKKWFRMYARSLLSVARPSRYSVSSTSLQVDATSATNILYPE